MFMKEWLNQAKWKWWIWNLLTENNWGTKLKYYLSWGKKEQNKQFLLFEISLVKKKIMTLISDITYKNILKEEYIFLSCTGIKMPFKMVHGMTWAECNLFLETCTVYSLVRFIFSGENDPIFDFKGNNFMGGQKALWYPSHYDAYWSGLLTGPWRLSQCPKPNFWPPPKGLMLLLTLSNFSICFQEEEAFKQRADGGLLPEHVHILSYLNQISSCIQHRF